MKVDTPVHSSPVDRPPARAAARWLLPAVVLIAWLLVGAVYGGLPGRLADVQSNDGVSFLPVAAEATEVTHLQQRLAGGNIQPAVVVFSSASKLTRADLAAVTARTRALARIDGPAGRASAPIPSRDGLAVQVVVPVASADGFQAGRTVEHIRTVVRTGLPAGLTVHVTGAAGFTADLGAVFGGIDGRLLLITALIVVLILVVVYRSPLLPLVVLASAGLALVTASLVVRPLAAHHVFTLSGQSQGILFILVFGASTDYALLLIARYREELVAERPRWEAIGAALRASFESITASASTVILGLLCLLFSELSSNRGLGPVAAVGIAASLLTSLTFLPAALVLLGRAAFWPFRPHRRPGPGVWGRVARLVDRRATAVWLLTALVLVALAAFAPMLRSTGVSESAVFLDRTDAVVGQDVVARHFPSGAGDPVVIMARRGSAADVAKAVRAVHGVAGVTVGTKVVAGDVEIDATLTSPTDSAAATDTVTRIRTDVHAIPGADAQVGGRTAIQLDIRNAAQRDRVVIIPIVLLVVFLVLVVLLRALVVPLMLIATVVLSFLATIGVGALVFNDVLHFPGSDPSVPLYAFVFLVALGVDYNIFLMTRVREEARRAGPREGTFNALRVTGGVISSAGIVLAATFSALAVLPILFLAQIAFLVAFGVLLDTLAVRSLLVPALTVHLGRIGWWPGGRSFGRD
jgi:putative drug exporter of the RND superfamily